MGRPLIADLTNLRFGRLVAKLHLGKGRWQCQCDCGESLEVAGGSLRTGNTQSCGCFRSEVIANLVSYRERTHHLSQTSEYRSWWAMNRRCSDENGNRFKYYKGRGISVCERWKESFESFLADMGRKPSPIHSVDRIDNDGNYEPENCRWATPQQQRANRSDSTRVGAGT